MRTGGVDPVGLHELGHVLGRVVPEDGEGLVGSQEVRYLGQLETVSLGEVGDLVLVHAVGQLIALAAAQYEKKEHRERRDQVSSFTHDPVPF